MDNSLQYPELNLLIGGQAQAAGNRRTLDVIDPATQAVLGRLPVATAEDIDAALDAAHRSFPRWRETPALERAAVLRRAATLMRERTPRLAWLITRELGKPLAESEKEVATAAEMFEWAAEEARRTYGRLIPGRVAGIRQMAIPEPVGPVAAFSGWNAPAITPSRKIAGALGAGCSIVIKPSEETPAIALEIGRALADAGLPAGTLNMLFGDPGEISRRLIESPLIRMVTFTGSTSIGRELAVMAAAGLKRATLELGGHAPVLVFDDADIEAAADTVLAAKLRNSGQICTSPTRMYVQQSVYERFVARLAERARGWRVGNGLDAGVQMGPLANPRRLAAMESMVANALACGAQLAAGGVRPDLPGWFWTPTVLRDAGTDSLAANTEPFGPLALVSAFRDLDEGVALANRLPFGLAAYVYTRDAARARAATERIESGVVCVNHCQASLPETPFGGFKDSGLGKEGGVEGLQEFMQVKYVSQM
ncbi:NAD-dependent succinate-semialdehyde dehydrogenase [Achromobacter anxifer]|jgi:succinate-semialdehyde dehydrogenase/glutarate-semialdehyde dehydrogenase|uniref:Alpha-ketoglutaric semialdehyde dehydrogenase 1 n=1 Tax=Achromobacter anxifer TaxID=1287737 RepID=A0A6S7CRX1_9BURK|nr:NAD-dependent succinate-semialdehyde dehydrogenase [Achromobacter anxifer]MDF8361795.1 NAD-dependent succinate-semialdehyde dehydrogenase [Achromobacter anxifer]CAB3849327.1 Alpha-ketoglutaric semialdehyde dehydrogenase 1 [Achromobacter anxifer]CAB5513706.1 Alpha-ketoglutaric semialdehyde dehydrogenase 1 [Achromobacter anxifer]